MHSLDQVLLKTKNFKFSRFCYSDGREITKFNTNTVKKEERLREFKDLHASGLLDDGEYLYEVKTATNGIAHSFPFYVGRAPRKKTLSSQEKSPPEARPIAGGDTVDVARYEKLLDENYELKMENAELKAENRALTKRLEAIFEEMADGEGMGDDAPEPEPTIKEKFEEMLMTMGMAAAPQLLEGFMKQFNTNRNEHKETVQHERTDESTASENFANREQTNGGHYAPGNDRSYNRSHQSGGSAESPPEGDHSAGTRAGY